MGKKDRRPWRKLVKKLRRQRKRQLDAEGRNLEEEKLCKNEHHNNGESESDNGKGKHSDMEDCEVDDIFFLSGLEYAERERQSNLAHAMKIAQEERLAQIEAEKMKKMKEEWEARQEEQRKLKEEKERLERLIKEKQVHIIVLELHLQTEAEFEEFLKFLSGDIETPPTQYLMPDLETEESEVCHYFSRTAACRFFDRCMKRHPRPTLSTAILIPSFFSHFKLEQSLRDEYDTDLGLEYEDKELYHEFLEFYNDVLPEFQKFGTVVQFKVCCNLEPQLRGNVYIQYETIRESVQAFRKFNGRFYNGKQLSLEFIKLDSWRAAICGSFLRKACVKGRTCSYLHVFRNPTKEFVKADRDWKVILPVERLGNLTVDAVRAVPVSHVLIVSSTACEKSLLNNASSANVNIPGHPGERKSTGELTSDCSSLTHSTSSASRFESVAKHTRKKSKKHKRSHDNSTTVEDTSDKRSKSSKKKKKEKKKKKKKRNKEKKESK